MRISLLKHQAVNVHILLSATRTLVIPNCRYRFSAFWLRSKCSICSYQLNIWYGGHVPPSILNWFLEGDRVQELAPALSRVDLALQYRQDRPTSPLTKNKLSGLKTVQKCKSTKAQKFFHLGIVNNFENIFVEKYFRATQKYFLSTI